MEIIDGSTSIRLYGQARRFPFAEVDFSTGLALLNQMRADELARLAEEEAEASEAEESQSEDNDDDDLADALASTDGKFDPVGLIAVFTEDSLRKSFEMAKNQDSERKGRFESVLKSAKQNYGYRTAPVTDIKHMAAVLASMRDEFPNFAHALDALEASLALSVGDMDYSIPPMLLHGEPGIGKTTFAMSIADRLGVGFDMVSAGSLQAGFDLSGTSNHWGNASAGRIVRLMADSKSASPVLLIDEVDKIGGEERFSPLTTMLDLLEPRTARRFRDEALQLQFDASRLIVLMTANDLHSIPAPLRSRSQVIAIEPLTAAQRFAIVRKMVDRHAGALAIDDGTVERIGNTGDLRKLQQIIKKAAGLALSRGDSGLFHSIIAAESRPESAKRMGF